MASTPKDLSRETRKLYQYLVLITSEVSWYLAALDVLIAFPEGAARGQELAILSNGLEYANDQARYFGLGIDHRTDKKRSLSPAEVRKLTRRLAL